MLSIYLVLFGHVKIEASTSFDHPTSLQSHIRASRRDKLFSFQTLPCALAVLPWELAPQRNIAAGTLKGYKSTHGSCFARPWCGERDSLHSRQIHPGLSPD